MATLRHLHQLMNERRTVRLSDGRVGKVVRVDTVFPDNATIVSVWTDAHESDTASAVSGPSISKVALTDIVGEAVRESA